MPPSAIYTAIRLAEPYCVLRERERPCTTINDRRRRRQRQQQQQRRQQTSKWFGLSAHIRIPYIHVYPCVAAIQTKERSKRQTRKRTTRINVNNTSPLLNVCLYACMCNAFDCFVLLFLGPFVCSFLGSVWQWPFTYLWSAMHIPPTRPNNIHNCIHCGRGCVQRFPADRVRRHASPFNVPVPVI